MDMHGMHEIVVRTDKAQFYREGGRIITLSYVLLARMPSNGSMPDFAVGIRLETVLWERLWERYGHKHTD